MSKKTKNKEDWLDDIDPILFYKAMVSTFGYEYTNQLIDKCENGTLNELGIEDYFRHKKRGTAS